MRIKFKPLAPITYAEKMQEYYNVKTIKKLPGLQKHIIDWMRDQVNRSSTFEPIKRTNHGVIEMYVIQPHPQEMCLQFPVDLFEVDEITGHQINTYPDPKTGV